MAIVLFKNIGFSCTELNCIILYICTVRRPGCDCLISESWYWKGESYTTYTTLPAPSWNNSVHNIWICTFLKQQCTQNLYLHLPEFTNYTTSVSSPSWSNNIHIICICTFLKQQFSQHLCLHFPELTIYTTFVSAPTLNNNIHNIWICTFLKQQFTKHQFL